MAGLAGLAARMDAVGSRHSLEAFPVEPPQHLRQGKPSDGSANCRPAEASTPGPPAGLVAPLGPAGTGLRLPRSGSAAGQPAPGLEAAAGGAGSRQARRCWHGSQGRTSSRERREEGRSTGAILYKHVQDSRAYSLAAFPLDRNCQPWYGVQYNTVPQVVPTQARKAGTELVGTWRTHLFYLCPVPTLPAHHRACQRPTAYSVPDVDVFIRESIRRGFSPPVASQSKMRRTDRLDLASGWLPTKILHPYALRPSSLIKMK